MINHPAKDINISSMEQISLEQKVSNTLEWLANKIACIQVYHWNEEYKKESLNYAWKKVQEQFKKDIDWNALTESQCKALHFKSWQSEEDVKEEISCLQSALEKGHLTKEEFDKKVSKEKNTLGLRLIPLYIYPSLPIGITLTSINGEERVFDGSNIDTDIRFGCLAWGIKPKKD
jgi:rRNA maturation endonuclease Nob1